MRATRISFPPPGGSKLLSKKLSLTSPPHGGVKLFITLSIIIPKPIGSAIALSAWFEEGSNMPSSQRLNLENLIWKIQNCLINTVKPGLISLKLNQNAIQCSLSSIAVIIPYRQRFTSQNDCILSDTWLEPIQRRGPN